MSQHYLKIISRSEFSDLYKFGHLFICNPIPFDGNIQNHADDKTLFDALTAFMNTYDYSSEFSFIRSLSCIISSCPRMCSNTQ